MEKIMRLHSVTSTIENGFVYLPTEADWLAVYLHELTVFPNGKHDDQADSTAGLGSGDLSANPSVNSANMPTAPQANWL